MDHPNSPIDTYIEFRDASTSLSEMCDKFGIPKFDHEDRGGRYPLSLPDRALRLCRRFDLGLAHGRKEGDSVAFLKSKFVEYDLAISSDDEDDPPFMDRVALLVKTIESGRTARPELDFDASVKRLRESERVIFRGDECNVRFDEKR